MLFGKIIEFITRDSPGRINGDGDRQTQYGPCSSPESSNAKRRHRASWRRLRLPHAALYLCCVARDIAVSYSFSFFSLFLFCDESRCAPPFSSGKKGTFLCLNKREREAVRYVVHVFFCGFFSICQHFFKAFFRRKYFDRRIPQRHSALFSK